MQETIDSPRLDVRRRIGWVVLIGVTLSMYLCGIGHEPLWLDETYSYSMVQHGFLDVLRLTTRDVHPPLYYLFLKAGTLVFGTSPVALRLPSVIAALGLSALALFPVRRLFGIRTAYVFALLVAISPGFVCFAQEARMYTLAAFLVTGAAVYGRLALLEGRKADLWWFGLCTWAAAMTHYFGLVAVGVNGLYVVVTARTRNSRHWKSLALVMLGAAILYSPWLVPLALQTAAVSKGFWIPPMNLNLFTLALVTPFTYKFEDVPYPWQALPALAIVAIVIVGSLVVKSWRGHQDPFRARVQLIAIYISTIAFGLAFSSLIQPILMPRYVMVCAGVLLLATASGLDAITAQTKLAFRVEARRRSLGWLAAIGLRTPILPSTIEARHLSLAFFTSVLAALGLPAALRIHRETFHGPFHALAERVNGTTQTQSAMPLVAGADETPLLLHVDMQTLLPAWHTIHNGRHVLLLDTDASFDVSQSGVYDVRRLSATRDLGAALANTHHAWLVDMDPTGFHLDPARILEHPGWHQLGPPVALALPMSWVRIRLSHFERRP